jgi:hypothetical protein
MDLAFYQAVQASFELRANAAIGGNLILPPAELPTTVNLISIRPNVTAYDNLYYHEGHDGGQMNHAPGT